MIRFSTLLGLVLLLQLPRPSSPFSAVRPFTVRAAAERTAAARSPTPIPLISVSSYPSHRTSIDSSAGHEASDTSSSSSGATPSGDAPPPPSSSLALVSSKPVPNPPRVDALGSLSPFELRLKSRRTSRQSRLSIIKFAVPAIGVWLCNPILSLVDTSVVGVFSGTFDQAALSPAVAITDYSMICLSFMFTATTNLIATVSKTSPEPGVPSPASKILKTSLSLSGLIGLFLGAVVLVSSGPLVRLMIGATPGVPVDPNLFWPAVKYVRIRSLGFPAAVALGSAQSACLGLKDTRSPLLILLAAGVMNLFADLILVPCKYAWFNGAAGAAWATTLSQYVALGLFLKHLSRPPVAPKLPLSVEVSSPSSSPSSSSSSASSSSFDTRGFLGSRFKLRELAAVPTVEAMKPFGKFFVPVTTTMVSGV